MQRAFLIVLALTASVSAEPARKPSAPIQLTIESRPVVGGYQVTLVAIPTRPVAAVELSLAGTRITFGATVAGQRRELSTKVVLAAGAGLDVVGSAAAAGRNKAAVLRLGAARRQAPKRSTIRTLPDGREIEEVR